MDFAVKGHDRSEAAGAEAGNGFQGIEPVVRGLSLAGKAKVLINSIVDWLRFTDVAGRPIADLDNMTALGFQRKVFVEGCHTVYLGNTDAQFFCNQGQYITAEILILSLDVLHDGNDVFPLAAVGIDDFARTVQHCSFCIHISSSLSGIGSPYPEYCLHHQLMTVTAPGVSR